jgi:hypothetical protein
MKAGRGAYSATREATFAKIPPRTRRILIDVASRMANFRGTDRFGTNLFVETQADGSQVWVYVREGQITNGGANSAPEIFG